MAKTTILRFEKIKNMANVRQSGAHQFRHHAETPNADPAKKHLNKTIFGSGNLGKDVQSKLDKLTKLPRKNAVLCMDGMLSISPELFDKKGNLNAWANGAKKWLHEQFGDNLVSAVVHLDESSPHISFAVVPVDTKKDGRKVLNARDMFGKQALADMQKSYNVAMQKLIPEIQPPKHGSKATHTTIKQFYSQIDAMADAFGVELQQMRESLYTDAKSTILDKLQPHIERLFVDFEEKLGNPIPPELREELLEKYNKNAESVLGFAFQDSMTAKALEKRMEEKKVELKEDAKKPFKLERDKNGTLK
jgi:hypothetical protein